MENLRMLRNGWRSLLVMCLGRYDSLIVCHVSSVNTELQVAILVDDMIDSGNTLSLAARTLHEKGAKSVHALISHGTFCLYYIMAPSLHLPVQVYCPKPISV